MFRIALTFALMLAVTAGGEEPPAGPVRPVPGVIETSALEGFDELSADRRELVAKALEMAARHRLNRYLFGSADPARGGFDCSGAVYFILRQVDIQPPRSSAAQFDWLRKRDRLVAIPEDVGSLDDAIFAELRPGDLLFWGGTYQPTDGRTNGVTHVQMYLGREKDGARPVMIGSSDGRSYRGSARCGFGVFDFRLPRAGSRARFLGYGTPVGIGDE